MSTNDGWFKSSFSNGSGNCVEVRFTSDGVGVRDSKDRGGPQLSFTPSEWSAFLKGVNDGQFHRPA